jgi:hypothetical protein
VEPKHRCWYGGRAPRPSPRLFSRQRLARFCLYASVFSVWSIIVSANAQVGFDRPGGDYTSFVLTPADPNQCASRCEHDGHCRAWSFSYPVTESTNALCWLKNEVHGRVKASCCVSGVRGAGVVEPRSGSVEFAIERPGGDYRSFELPSDPTAEACKAACDAEGRCRAWTYMRPGYVTPAARCFLKDHVKPPHHKPCCISGVVR